MRFCRFVVILRGGGSTRQPQRTEPCHCVSGQPCKLHEPLQGQMHPLQYVEFVVEPVLGPAAGLGRWFVGVAVLLNGGVFQFVETPLGNHSAQSPANVPWAYHGPLQGQIQPLQCEAGLVEHALGAAAGLGRWFVGDAFLPICGDFQRRGQHLASTAHRALPVCKWPALDTPWGTVRSGAASAVCSRCGGACTGGSGGAGQVVCGGCGVAGLCRFPQDKAALGKHIA